jgi:hypothetical protein
MYTFCDNEALGLIVGVYSGGVTADADYMRCIESIASADKAAVRAGVPLACVLVTDENTRQPSVLWRKRMADANNAIESERYYFALVTSSFLIRGVMTAIGWLVRPRPHHETGAFDSLESAGAWLQSKTGRHYPVEETYSAARRLRALA